MRSFRKRSFRTMFATSLAALAAVAWWWPGLAGQGAQTDVLILPSSSIIRSREFIERRLREEGFTTQWDAGATPTCSIAAPRLDSWEVLVVGLPDVASCPPERMIREVEQLESSLPNRRIVVVLSWRDDVDDRTLIEPLEEISVRTVDPRDLIDTTATDQPCLWWDDCPVNGRVDTHVGRELTDAGSQRLARSIVAEVL